MMRDRQPLKDSIHCNPLYVDTLVCPTVVISIETLKV